MVPPGPRALVDYSSQSAERARLPASPPCGAESSLSGAGGARKRPVEAEGAFSSDSAAGPVSGSGAARLRSVARVPRPAGRGPSSALALPAALGAPASTQPVTSEDAPFPRPLVGVRRCSLTGRLAHQGSEAPGGVGVGPGRWPRRRPSRRLADTAVVRIPSSRAGRRAPLFVFLLRA